jgi:hypothetical protein
LQNVAIVILSIGITGFRRLGQQWRRLSILRTTIRVAVAHQIDGGRRIGHSAPAAKRPMSDKRGTPV